MLALILVMMDLIKRVNLMGKTFHRGSLNSTPRRYAGEMRWRRMVTFTFRPLYPGERAYASHCMGGWVDPSVGMTLNIPG